MIKQKNINEFRADMARKLVYISTLLIIISWLECMPRRHAERFSSSPGKWFKNSFESELGKKSNLESVSPTIYMSLFSVVASPSIKIGKQ